MAKFTFSFQKGVWLIQLLAPLAIKFCVSNAFLSHCLLIFDLCYVGEGSDFTVTGSQLIFPAQVTANRDIQCLMLTIVNDDVLEGDDQMFGVSLLTDGIPVNVITEDNITRYIISDDELDGM